MPTLYEQILSKPKTYRRRLSYAITAILGVLIFTIWLIITNYSMKEAFNFRENFGGIGTSITEDLEAPSFYNETENFKPLEQNLDNLMQKENNSDL